MGVNTLIKFSVEQMLFAKDLAIKRSGSMNHADTKNSQNFIKDKQPWWRHFIGVVGEMAYSIYSDYPIDQTTIGRGDSGVDFPNGVQVKASDTVLKPNLMFPVSQFNRKIARTYVLVWVFPTGHQAEIIGSISREDIEKHRTEHDFGYGNTYIVSNKHLELV